MIALLHKHSQDAARVIAYNIRTWRPPALGFD